MSFTTNKTDNIARQTRPATEKLNLSARREPDEKVEIPQQFLWLMAFELNSTLEKEAEQRIAVGEDGKPFSNYFKKNGKLSDEQTAAFKEKAAACLQTIEPIDAEAKAIIEKFWEGVPKDKLTDQSALPKPPEELRELQDKKDRMILSCRDSFKEAVGTEAFGQFSNFLNGDFSAGAKQLKSDKLYEQTNVPELAIGFSFIIWDDNLVIPWVAGFGGTVHDFWTGVYFHPYVISGLLNDTTGTWLHVDDDRGFAFIYPAIVVHTPYPATPNNWYCTYSEHYGIYRALLWENPDGDNLLKSGLVSSFPNSLKTPDENNLGYEWWGDTWVCHMTQPNQCEDPGLGNCATPTPTPTPSPTPQVSEVGFEGDYPMRKFATRTAIPNTTWKRADGPANAGNVVAYKKGTETTAMKLFATFTLPTAVPADQPISVKVRVKYNNTPIAETAQSITVTGSSFTVNDLQVTSALEQTPKIKRGVYDFNWEVTLDNGEIWRDAGTSQHVIYWTYDKPVNIDNDATCEGDAEKRNCISINQGGEHDFPGLYDLALEQSSIALNTSTQADEASIAKDLARYIDSEIAYKPNSTAANTDADHPLIIFIVREAQCSGNANLLLTLLRSLGIKAETFYTWGGNPSPTPTPVPGMPTPTPVETGGRANFYVYRRYTPTPTPSPMPSPTPTPSVLRLDGIYTFKVKRPRKETGGEDVVKDPHFTFHATVKLANNEKYYDPSYGADLYNDSDYPFSSIKLVETVDFPTADFSKPKFKKGDKTIPFTVYALTMKTFCTPKESNNFCASVPNANIARTEKLCEHSERPPSAAPLPDPFFSPDRPISYFDNDLSTDISVFRPSEGKWYVRRSSDETMSVHEFTVSYAKLVPDDYDGDGITDYAVRRTVPMTNTKSTWWILNSSDNTTTSISFGTATDKPVVGDIDGDRKADVGVYRPGGGTWYFQGSTVGLISIQWGVASDKPVIGDFDHDHKSDIAVYRPSEGVWYIVRSSDGTASYATFGIAEDIPLPADYDGDGTTDVAVYRPSNSTWYVLGSTDGFFARQVGSVGSIPVVGDYDGDLITDFATWTESNGIWTIWSTNDEEVKYINWGTTGDIPVPSAFNR